MVVPCYSLPVEVRRVVHAVAQGAGRGLRSIGSYSRPRLSEVQRVEAATCGFHEIWFLVISVRYSSWRGSFLVIFQSLKS